MHLRIVLVREGRRKHLSLSVYYQFVKVCLVGVNLPAFSVYTCVSAYSALTRVHDKIRGAHVHKARSTGLSQ